MLDPIYYRPDGSRRSYEERKALRKAEEEGRIAGKMVAARVKEEVREVLDATTPAHLKRPLNRFAALADQFEASPQYKNATLLARIAKYRALAIAEDRRIDAAMAERKRRWEIDNDPAVKEALAHCERAEQHADESEKGAWAVARGLAQADAVREYWAEAARLTGAARERTLAKLDEHGAALDNANRDYTQTHVELERIDTLRSGPQKVSDGN